MIPAPGEKFDHLFPTQADLAEHHGVLCGLLCLRDEYEARVEWLQLLKDENLGGEQSHEFDEFIDDARGELSSESLSFSPWLPADSTSLDERVGALAAWSEGFLAGLGIGGIAARDVPAEVNEFIEDLAEVSRAEINDEDDGEDGENAYAELVEFLRIGTQLCFEHFAPLEQRDTTTIH